MTQEPLSPFARSILGSIGGYPVRQGKIIPAMRDLFLQRGLIAAGVLGRDDVWQITPAGTLELASTDEQLKGDAS